MAAVIPLTTIANLPLTINLPSIPSPRGLPSILDKAQRERSLSPSSAALITLLVQSYGESHTVEVSAISALALLLTCGRECAVRPLVLRFHLFPLLQGYIAANLARRAARILYSSFFDNLFESREAASRRGSLYAYRGGLIRGPLSKLFSPLKRAVGVGVRLLGGVQAPPLGMAAGARRPLAARVVTRGRNALPGAAQWSREEPPPLTPKKRILILISDTGGGHRASAQALAETLKNRHGEAIETEIVDVWTEFGPWPWGKKMVPLYRSLAKRPKLWHAHFRASALTPVAYGMSRFFSSVAYRCARLLISFALLT